MVEAEQIILATDAIVRQFDPAQIILFGSYAYGEPTPDSDIDLMVVMEYSGSPTQAAADVRGVVSPAFSVDVLVRSPSEIRKRIALNDFFILDVIEKGMILYDAADSRMGQQGRRRLRDRIGHLQKAQVS